MPEGLFDATQVEIFASGKTQPDVGVSAAIFNFLMEGVSGVAGRDHVAKLSAKEQLEKLPVHDGKIQLVPVRVWKKDLIASLTAKKTL